MFIKKFVLRAAGASLAAIVLLTTQQLRAESSSDTARIEKLEAQWNCWQNRTPNCRRRSRA